MIKLFLSIEIIKMVVPVVIGHKSPMIKPTLKTKEA
jgi:hypothetical protein